MKITLWTLFIILSIMAFKLERRIQEKEARHQRRVMDDMVKAEVENWFFKENLERRARGLEPLNWEKADA